MHEMFIFLTVMQYFHCYFVFFEREVHVFTSKTVSLKALFIEQLVIAELSLAQNAFSGAPWVRKFGYLCI